MVYKCSFHSVHYELIVEGFIIMETVGEYYTTIQMKCIHDKFKGNEVKKML